MAVLAKRDAGSYATELVKSAGLDAVAGVWLFVSAFVFEFGEKFLFMNNVTCGALAAILAFGAFAHVRLAWLPAFIGLWVMASPFVLGFVSKAAAANNVITGLVLLVEAIHSWSVSKSAHDVGMMGD